MVSSRKNPAVNTAAMTGQTEGPGMRWTQSSVYSGIRVFVSTSVIETTAIEADHGTVAPDPNTGVNTQTTIGPADGVELDGNRVLVRLGLDKIDAAVGYPVSGTSSTASQAQTQILIGSSLTGGLLLNSDNANGSDFHLGDDGTNDDDNGGTPGVCAERIEERLAGAILPGDNVVEIAFSMRCTNLKAKINYHPGNQDVSFDLLDVHGDRVASAEASNGRSIEISGLTPGEYIYRVSGDISKNVDFVIRSVQQP